LIPDGWHRREDHLGYLLQMAERELLERETRGLDSRIASRSRELREKRNDRNAFKTNADSRQSRLRPTGILFSGESLIM